MPVRAAMAGVVGFDEALGIVALHAGEASRRDTETLALLASAGRVLARPVLADRDQPPFDRSTRDGFAVRADDLEAGRSLDVVGQVRAGDHWTGEPLAPGSAIEIMTGAPLPEGADAVLMVEHVGVEAGALRVSSTRSLRAGENVVLRGAEARAGATVLPAGSVIGPREIAAAASCGCAMLSIFARPRAAILSTGDELIELDAALELFQIRNSNSYALAALVETAGGEATRLPIVPDRHEAIAAAIRQARRSANLLLLSGGVSMGKYDLVEAVLAELGAEFFFTGVRMQPGKPVVFGRLPAEDGLPAIHFFGLPGNPLSVQVTFACFVEPLLRGLAGASGNGPRWTGAVLGTEAEARPGLTRLLPCSVASAGERVEVKLVPWQGSGDLVAGAQANGFVELRAERAYRAGDPVRVLSY